MIDGCDTRLVMWPRMCVAMVSYQEHAQRVKRQGKRMEASTVQPDFRILHRTRNVLPRNALIGHSITVRTKTSGDELFFFRSDECCLGWPVHHIPVGAYCKNDGEDALDNENPSVSWSVDSLQALDVNVIYLQPLRPATPLICPIPHARIPPKAPAMEAAEKNKATRYWRSERLYHCEACVSL